MSRAQALRTPGRAASGGNTVVCFCGGPPFGLYHWECAGYLPGNKNDYATAIAAHWVNHLLRRKAPGGGNWKYGDLVAHTHPGLQGHAPAGLALAIASGSIQQVGRTRHRYPIELEAEYKLAPQRTTRRRTADRESEGLFPVPPP
jgi:hypothetical protein